MSEKPRYRKYWR